MRRRSFHLLILAASAIVHLVTPAPGHGAGFLWQEAGGETTLLYNDRPAARYMHEPLDESSPEARERSFKPYHHVFSPDGSTLLTKGPGGLYPHHHGVFFGFNRVTYHGDKTCDNWHCTDRAFQSHAREISRSADDNSARHRALIEWHGREGEVFATEEREFAMTRPTLNGVEGWQIDWASHVESADGQPIHLDGDPQHAGFHFRAPQEVAEVTAPQTYYLRTDGKGALDESRNWDIGAGNSPMNVECENRPWNAMSVVLGGKRYTILYLDHPSNPRPARYSERDYGRFGSYFVYDVTKELPLNVKYRLWVQDGEMTVDQCAAMSMASNSEGAVLPTSDLATPRRDEVTPPANAVELPNEAIQPADAK
jgi:hypothetical protein